MKQEEILKLLLAFVLGFMVCKVCKVSGAGKLVEGSGCHCEGGSDGGNHAHPT